MRTWTLHLGLVALLQLMHLAPAAAQYKNASFALDAAGTFITRPSAFDENGSLRSNARLPNRLAYGERLGAEVNFKLHSDHWWFTGRLNVPLYSFSTLGETPQSINYQYDLEAKDATGLVLGLQGVAGVRYYFLTDRVRPYFGLGISYMRLFSFTGQTGELCALQLCTDGGTYGDVFLPHQNILATHLVPGIEFVIKRDLALVVALDYQRWLLINAPGNNVFNLTLGVTFYG